MFGWKLRGDRYERDQVPEDHDPKFITARKAAELVKDKSTVAVSGFGAFYVPSVLLWAIRDRYDETGTPSDLTVWCANGIGGRGKAPGTIEELAVPGLVETAVMGHAETAKSFLEMADEGQLEIHCLPQGQNSFLLEALAYDHDSLVTKVGAGTYLDPRVGPGTSVLPDPKRQFVSVENGDKLRYSVPVPDVVLLNASHADSEGNLYIQNPAMLTDAQALALAGHRHNATVIACVSEVAEPDDEAVFIPAIQIDAIVVDDNVSQFHSVRHREALSVFQPEASFDSGEALADLTFTNRLSGAAPRRGLPDRKLARAAARLVAPEIPEGALVNIGVGLPEEIGRELRNEVGDRMTLSTEAGAIGGTPASGIFFGASLAPNELLTPAAMFHRYQDELELTCLGMLEFDELGNVNVSRRGPNAQGFVGPGGFLDIAEHARTVIFAGSFAAKEKLRIGDQGIEIEEPGQPKLVHQVQEVTFSGPAALQRGQTVIYATHRAFFRLTECGLEVTHLMPGIDLDKDVLSAPGRIVMPEEGRSSIQTIRV